MQVYILLTASSRQGNLMMPFHNVVKDALLSCRAEFTCWTSNLYRSCAHLATFLPSLSRFKRRHVCPGPKRTHRQSLPSPTIGVHSTRKLMTCHLGEEWATVPVTLCRQLHHRMSDTWRNRAQDSTNSAKGCAIVEAYSLKHHRREELKKKKNEKKGSG